MKTTGLAGSTAPLLAESDATRAPASGDAGGFAAQWTAALEGRSSPPPPSPAHHTVTVGTGDTVWALVRQSLEAEGAPAGNGDVQRAVRGVASSNALANPDRIYPGQTLVLDADATAPAVAGAGPAGSAAAALRAAQSGGQSAGRSASLAGLATTARELVPASRVTSGFGVRSDPLDGDQRFHEGIDIAAPTGSPIHSAGGGVVSFAGERSGYGRLVVVEHEAGVSTYYAHASELLVRAGQHVDRGTVVARVGQSGRATGPHLHFEVRDHGTAVDPARLDSLLALDDSQ